MWNKYRSGHNFIKKFLNLSVWGNSITFMPAYDKYSSNDKCTEKETEYAQSVQKHSPHFNQFFRNDIFLVHAQFNTAKHWTIEIYFSNYRLNLRHFVDKQNVIYAHVYMINKSIWQRWKIYRNVISNLIAIPIQRNSNGKAFIHANIWLWAKTVVMSTSSRKRQNLISIQRKLIYTWPMWNTVNISRKKRAHPYNHNRFRCSICGSLSFAPSICILTLIRYHAYQCAVVFVSITCLCVPFDSAMCDGDASSCCSCLDQNRSSARCKTIR